MHGRIPRRECWDSVKDQYKCNPTEQERTGSDSINYCCPVCSWSAGLHLYCSLTDGKTLKHVETQSEIVHCHKFNPLFLWNLNKLSDRFNLHWLHSFSLKFCQNPSKTNHSVTRNVSYKVISSLLLPRPPHRSHTCLPVTLSRPSSRQNLKISGPRYVGKR